MLSGARESTQMVSRIGLHLIALPLFDCIDVKPPVTTDAKPRQFAFPEQPINCGFVDLQIFGQFRNV
jgi:hypothetical protein